MPIKNALLPGEADPTDYTLAVERGSVLEWWPFVHPLLKRLVSYGYVKEISYHWPSSRITFRGRDGYHSISQYMRVPGSYDSPSFQVWETGAGRGIPSNDAKACAKLFRLLVDDDGSDAHQEKTYKAAVDVGRGR